jgi:hypothetical protein
VRLRRKWGGFLVEVGGCFGVFFYFLLIFSLLFIFLRFLIFDTTTLINHFLLSTSFIFPILFNLNDRHFQWIARIQNIFQLLLQPLYFPGGTIQHRLAFGFTFKYLVQFIQLFLENQVLFLQTVVFETSGCWFWWLGCVTGVELGGGRGIWWDGRFGEKFLEDVFNWGLWQFQIHCLLIYK